MANAISNSAARKRKLEDIIRNEPMRVIQHPIRLWSSHQNIDVASNFFEVWLDDKYQVDLVYCQASRKIVTRQKRHNYNLLRHLNMFTHKSNKQNEDCNIPDVQMREVVDGPRQTGSPSKRDRESTFSTSEREGASAASVITGETELETQSTSTIGNTEL